VSPAPAPLDAGRQRTVAVKQDRQVEETDDAGTDIAGLRGVSLRGFAVSAFVSCFQLVRRFPDV